MFDIDPDAWMKMITDVIAKYEKRLESVDFWVETKDMYDKHGNVYSQAFPRLAINFK
tara:strand:- start:2222 stop:2392 length:171 start_codon:yes stop_codon:yes gene_type:complete